jgi:hypothetical protein
VQILALDGSPQAGSLVSSCLARLAPGLEARGHRFRILALREREVFPCRGCFQCWVKTPGECRIRDGMPEVLRAVIGADLVLHASPLLMGFPSALLRRATERHIPLIHPYLALVEGECHHRARYPRYPLLALLLDPAGSDAEDLEIVERAYQRLALNFMSALAFLATTAATPEEICHAVDGVQRFAPRRQRQHSVAAAALPRGLRVGAGA